MVTTCRICLTCPIRQSRSFLDRSPALEEDCSFTTGMRYSPAALSLAILQVPWAAFTLRSLGPYVLLCEARSRSGLPLITSHILCRVSTGGLRKVAFPSKSDLFCRECSWVSA